MSPLNIYLNLFSNESNAIWLNDVAGNSIRVNFKGADAMFDNTTNSFSVSKDKFKALYDSDFLNDDAKESYKKLHYTYMEISLNYGDRIHYDLV